MGKAKNPFKGLNIDRDKILDYITDYCDANYSLYEITDLHKVGKNDHQMECIIYTDEKEIKIHFYYNKDNTTTISPRVGTEQEESIKIASYILENLEFKPSVSSSSYSVKLDKETYSFIIEYFDELSTCELITKVRNDSGRYMMHQYKSNIGDKITFKYYDNMTFQVQGKPSYLYTEVTSLLADKFPFEEIVKKQSEMYYVPLEVDEIQEEIKNLFPTAYVFFDSYEPVKSIFTGSLALRKIDIDLPDYSGFIHPALKTVEMYLVYLFLKKGIKVSIKEGFGEYFYYNEFNDENFLKNEIRDIIGCHYHCEAIEKTYKFIKKYRHGYSHSGERIVDTKLVETKSKADNIINSVVNLIESTYKTLP